MDTSFDLDMQRVLDRIQERRRAQSGAASAGKPHRTGRAEVLTALPRLLARLSNCISAANERLGDEGVLLRLEIGAHTPAFEATFTVKVEDSLELTGPDLVFMVDYSGRLSMQFAHGERTIPVRTTTVFDADRAMLSKAIVELLDARYGSEP